MRRTQLTLMTGIAALTLSCGARSIEAPLLADGVAAPAVQVAAAAEPEPAAPRPVEDPRTDDLVAFLSEKRTGLTGGEVRELARAILRESQRHDLDMRLVLALMYVESRYNAFAVSPVGAMGLMQILPSTGEELAHELGIEWRGPQTLFDPVVNVRLGVTYVKQLSDRYDGSLRTALAAYNWGPGHVDRRLRRGTPVPRVYPRLVMDAYGVAKLRHSS